VTVIRVTRANRDEVRDRLVEKLAGSS
jgi:hypothetical protein